MIKTLSKLALFVLALYALQNFCYHRTKGFALTKTRSNFAYRPEWEIEKAPSLPLDQVLDQRFTYFARGGQAWAFVSDDGKYVLKLFKLHRRRLPKLIEHFPLPRAVAKRRARQLKKKTDKLLRDFRSYKLSFEEMEEETGLIYVHLNRSRDFNCTARIVDPLNIEHEVDLTKSPFVLQHRAETPYPHIERLYREGKIEEVKAAIHSVCSVIESRCRKGIHDEDAKIHRNFGFLNDKAILIDVGRMRPEPKCVQPDVIHSELRQITEKFSTFLESLDEELADYLMERIAGE